MGFLESLLGRGSSRDKAVALYKRGMSKAQKHDHNGAIEDYSAAIEMPDVPLDVKAMAQYNRSLVYAAANDNAKAVGDLKGVLAMEELPTNVKTAAEEKLKRIKRRYDESHSPEL